MPSTEKELPTGITELTREKHRYEGFVIRAQRNRYIFRKYVSGAALHNRRLTPKERRAHALQQAITDNSTLQTILADKKIWHRNGSLQKKVIAEIKKHGFVVKEGNQ